MAYYRLSTMMKLKRELLGHSRDDFDVEGPSGMTVYRMEEGKNKMSESSFRKLTRAMGMEESTGRGLLRTKELERLMKTNDISDFFLEKQYGEIEAILGYMEKSLDLKIPRNMQYISWIKLKIEFKKEHITANEFSQGLQEILLYTCPTKDKNVLAKWPYCVVEWKIFFDNIVAVRIAKLFVEQIELLESAKVLLKTGYLETTFKTGYLIWSCLRVSDALGNMGFHENAIETGKKTLEICDGYDEIRYLPEIYYEIFWNYYMLKKKGKILTLEEESFCKQCLIKAYYLDKALFVAKELYLVRLQEIYPDVVYF